MTEPSAGRTLTIWRVITSNRWRVAWGYMAALLLLVLARPTPASILAGIPLVVAGEIIRIIANGTLIKDKELTNWGIYAHMRHPLYVGSTLIGLGFMLMAWNLLLVFAMVFFFFAVYRRTIRREEEKMEELYGERYMNWARSVPRYLPRRCSPAEIGEYFTFRKAWVNREHQGVLGVLALTVVLYLKYILS